MRLCAPLCARLNPGAKRIGVRSRKITGRDFSGFGANPHTQQLFAVAGRAGPCVRVCAVTLDFVLCVCVALRARMDIVGKLMQSNGCVCGTRAVHVRRFMADDVGQMNLVALTQIPLFLLHNWYAHFRVERVI